MLLECLFAKYKLFGPYVGSAQEKLIRIAREYKSINLTFIDCIV